MKITSSHRLGHLANIRYNEARWRRQNEVKVLAKKKAKEKYKPDEVATLMTDLKRMVLWISVSVVTVAALAFVAENVL